MSGRESFRSLMCLLAALVANACGTNSGANGGENAGGSASTGMAGKTQAGGSSAGGADGVGGASGGTNGVGGASGTSGGATASGGGGADGGSGSGGAAGNRPADGGAGGSANARPNVLIVLLDDMGYSDLGIYGGEVRTPNIDKLAEGGMRFRNYYVTPRCSPSRISLLTGLYTQQAATLPGDSLPPLRSDNNVTLPEMLSVAGYRTYMAGKWHLGAAADQVPRARGFDHVFGFGPQGAGAEANKWVKSEYGFVSKGNAIPARVYGDGPKDFYQAAAMGDYALDYLTYHYAQGDGAP